MHAILFCDREVSCIPVKSMPEALLPFCNLPLLAHILQHLDREGFTRITLIGADADTKALADSLTLQAQLHFSDSFDDIRPHASALVLHRLCLPEWDMAMPNTPQEYLRMQKKLLCNSNFRHLRIGQNVTIGKQVKLSPDTVIGSDCIIGDHAVLEGCVIGDGVQIGAGTTLRSCVVCRHALIDRDMQLENAVIGEGEISSVHFAQPRKRRIVVDELDGVHEGLPRWNNAETALRTGAALTALGMRIAVGFENAGCEAYALAAAAGAASQGAQVWNCGVCALSQLFHAAASAGCGMVLHVHGSSVHYLTVRSADGALLSFSQWQELRRAMESRVSTRITDCGKLNDARCLISLWEADCRRILPPMQFTVEVCCGNAVLRNAAKSLFSGGTGDRLVLNLSDDGTQASVFSMQTGMVSNETLLRLASQCSEGGFINQAVFTDGILLFAHVLRILHQTGCTLAEVLKALPPLYTAKREISTRLGRQAVEKLRRKISDSRITLSLPTASGIVRMAAYADSMETASELCGFWEKKIRAAEEKWSDLSQYAE